MAVFLTVAYNLSFALEWDRRCGEVERGDPEFCNSSGARTKKVEPKPEFCQNVGRYSSHCNLNIFSLCLNVRIRCSSPVMRSRRKKAVLLMAPGPPGKPRRGHEALFKDASKLTERPRINKGNRCDFLRRRERASHKNTKKQEQLPPPSFNLPQLSTLESASRSAS